jgi:hypothetical protein
MLPMLFLLSLSASALAAPDSGDLVARLKRPAPAVTRYVEVRFVDLLTHPVTLHGSLEYGADGSLTKRVDSPYHETTTVRAGQVTLERDGKSPRRFALSRAPELAAFLESFGSLLGGDAARLAQTYEVSADGDDAHWRLTLTPRAAQLAKHLAHFRVDGAGSDARCFSVEEAGGDASIMLVEATAKAPLPAVPTKDALSALCRGTQ